MNGCIIHYINSASGEIRQMLIRGLATVQSRRPTGRASKGYQIGKLHIALSVFLAVLLSSIFSGLGAMTEMEDDELADISGQALMQMGKTPGGAGFTDLTFYKAGLDAEIELNMNIAKLQLGCTANAINGQYCDIDIDNMSLSGKTWTNGRPESAAILTRPFFEFAIKNDQSKTLREVVGIRMSAEQASGMLTTGQNDGTANGINTLSGYMVTTPVTGTAQTEPAVFGGPGDPNNTVLTIAAYINALGVAEADIITQTDPGQGTGIALPSLDVPFESAAGAVVNDRRLTSTSVVVTGNVPTISFPASSNNNPTTQLLAEVVACNGSGLVCNAGDDDDGDGVDDYVVYANQGSVTGLTLEANFTESLGFIHKIEVDSPFSLSFQKQAVKWPNTAAANIAQQGWWMSFEDAVELGDVSPANQVDVTQAFPQLAQALQTYFNNNPLQLGSSQAWTGIIGGYMNVNMPNMNLQTQVPGGTPPLSLVLQDEALGAAQDVVPNCWGTASFC